MVVLFGAPIRDCWWFQQILWMFFSLPDMGGVMLGLYMIYSNYEIWRAHLFFPIVGRKNSNTRGVWWSDLDSLQSLSKQSKYVDWSVYCMCLGMTVWLFISVSLVWMCSEPVLGEHAYNALCIHMLLVHIVLMYMCYISGRSKCWCRWWGCLCLYHP